MKQTIAAVIAQSLGKPKEEIEILIPEREAFGHYSTNIALKLAKQEKKNPLETAEALASAIREGAPAGLFEKVEAVPPGFINVWLSTSALREHFAALADDGTYGIEPAMADKTVMVEFTDPNPFKLFHIGHLMSNTIGESFARLYEAVGARVIRANYQGDVGLHVAMTVWAMRQSASGMPDEQAPLAEKVEYLGKAYAAGSTAYRGDEGSAKQEIEAINQQIYQRSNPQVNALYDMGRKWSLEYFEEIYRRLGTKFDRYFFESEVGAAGKELVQRHPGVFEQSEGAFVFRGEKHGLHTRVFINSRGLPTYEAKELGLNKTKFELYPLDLSIIVTGNEIVEYFRVLLKAMEQVLPEVAAKTRHVPHGMLRLPTGKMSSRTGDVITAEALIAQTKEKLKELNAGDSQLSPGEQEAVREATAVAALKYSILKQNPGQDIVFDFEKSLSLHGDSGVYLQYTHARLRSIGRKAGDAPTAPSLEALAAPVELDLMRKLLEFPDAVALSINALSASHLAKYLHELANLANRFYEMMPVLKEEDAARRAARLHLTAMAADALKKGLELLGIRAPDQI